MKVFGIALALFLSVFIVSGCQQLKSVSCIENRLAFDFGSGTLKAKAAQVNTCENRLLTVFYENQTKSHFKEDLNSSGSVKVISDASIENAIQFVSQVIKETQAFKVSKTTAVGTAALREASNTKILTAALYKMTKVQLETIEQNEEARLGYLSVISKPAYQGQQVIVWDIGGGSQQIIWGDAIKPNIIKSQVASISFKDEVIQKVKKQDPTKIKSPNPLKEPQIRQARKLAQDHGRAMLQEQSIPMTPETLIVGIGGVLGISVSSQVKTEKVHRNVIEKEIRKKINWNDKKIGGDYAETDLTNLILVLGLMDSFGFEKFQAEKINLTDGLLLK